MKRSLQIFVSLFFAALLPIVCLVVLSRGDGEWLTPRAVEKAKETSDEFGAYSQMALLAMKEPDERLLMPVKGVRTRQIADTWGAARSGGRGHTGQDIFAKKGTPVFSATEGYVLRVGENALGGKVVFVFGAGGRRYYYAHLDGHEPNLKAGDYVTTDTVLGYVGATGNAAGTPPHLHFAVYAAGGAIDPLPLLADRTQNTAIIEGKKRL